MTEVGSLQGGLAGLSKDKTELLKLLLEARSKRKQQIGRYPRAADVGGVCAPASWAQQRLWFIDQLENGSAAYNTGVAVRLRGALNPEAVRTALTTLIQRHEVLRTTFQAVGGDPVQRIAERGEFSLEIVDLRHCAPKDREAQVRLHKIEESRGKFDLSTGPLIRGRLLRLHDDEHILVVMMHHIISDAWSKGVLIAEFSKLYRSYSAGGDSSLDELPIQYADYAQWQREWLQGAELERQLSYWRERMAGASPLLQLPTDRLRPAVQTYRGDSLSIVLDADLCARVRVLAQRHEVTLFMFLCGTWSVLLSRLSGQDDVVIGTPIANRHKPELEGLIGFFVNTLALRFGVRDDLTMTSLLAQIKEVTLGAYDHQDVPFERIVEELQPERSLSRHPLFQVMMTLQNATGRELSLPGLTVSLEEKLYESSKFDLLLSLQEQGQQIVGEIEYAVDLFDPDTVKRWMDCFVVLLREMTGDSERPISELSILSQEERRRVVASFNETTIPYARHKLVHELFEEQAALTPDAVAVSYADERLTYAELNGRANRLARFLRDRGVGPSQLVGICVERSLEMVVGLLGILKAGGAYVPLDPNYPAERLQYMLEDSDPRVVLTLERLWDVLPTTDAHAVAIDALLQQVPEDGVTNLPAATMGLSSQDLAYVIYTSGTTGRPKGTAMPHRALVNLIDWHRRHLPLDQGQRVLQFAALSFDVAFQEIFSTLCLGGTLVLLDEWVRKDARALMELLSGQSIERLFLPPLMLQSLAECAKSSGACPRNLQDVITAGEQLRISPEITRLFGRLDRCRLHNHYGPTETHVVTALTLGGDPREWPAVPAIGRPISNTQIYILDARRQPVPTGIVGEIYIAGANVARGYLNRPELTTERFVRDSFSTDPQARMYKTGDLARWRSDGTIEYLGRNDDQVKIRGFRIELGDIEAHLALHARVKEAAVIAQEEVAGDKRLVAYVTPATDSPPSVEDLRAHMETALPEHMLPSAFVVLPSMPLTPSGKLNRRALPAPDDTAYATRHYERPHGEVEEIVAGIWQELLRVERVGRQDNFFSLGGHSLLLVQVMERLRRAGLSVDVRSMYESRTLGDLASVLVSRAIPVQEVPPNLIALGCRSITPEMLPLLDLSAVQIDRIVRTVPGGVDNVQDIYPLAPLQNGMLFHHLLDEQGEDTYVVSMLFALCSRQRLDEFLEALSWAINRHDILRTAVLWEQLPQAVQVVYRRAVLPVADVQLAADRDPVEQLRERMRPELQRLDVHRAPLMRLQVAADPHNEHWYAILQLHHLVCDHESLDSMLAEVTAYLRGRGQELPEPLPYRNHVAQATSSARALKAEAFFRARLGDIDEPTAPFGLVDVRGNGSRIERMELALDSTLAERVRGQARHLGVSAATLFHVAWALVVSQTSGRGDVVFGTVLLGRLQGSAGAHRILGLFMNTLPLRVQLDQVTVAELVEQTQRALVDLLSHEQTALSLAQRCSSIGGSAPLFTSLLNYRWSTVDLSDEFASVGMSRLAIRSYTNYPVTMSVLDQGQGFLLNLQTDRRIDTGNVMSYMTTAIQSLVEALEQSATRPARTLTVLPTQERRLVIDGFNTTQAVYPRAKLVHQLVEEQAARVPHATAVVCGDQELTYQQLNDRANEIAHLLAELGVRSDQRVGVCAERGTQLIAALLGILKAGAAYVPLDASYPRERLAYMIQDSAPVVVLSERSLRDVLPEVHACVIDLEDVLGGGVAEPRPNPDATARGLTARNLAYVIYTSGSTGTPKGVMIEHRGLANLIGWHCAAFDVGDGSRCSCLAALGFDAAVWEIWPSLSAGATLVLAPPTTARDTEAMLDWWADERLDVTFLPTPLAELAFARNRLNTGLRTLLVGGDRLRFRPVAHSFALINNYGPTEITVVATSGRLDDEDAVLHIGRPIANVRIYILDDRCQPVPLGVAGEIYAGGVGVARGYLNRPELTAERFLPDPFSADPQDRMYRTGDLGRWRSDGMIEYLGRNDHQVKIRGMRIEIGEIEAHLAAHSFVKDTVVIAREDVPGEKHLVAYVVPNQLTGDESDGVEALRASLKEALPEYMLPSAVVTLDRLPLTSNGKLDRRALPAPDTEAYAILQYEPPQGDVEDLLARIWQEALGIHRVGRRDSFFDLGGHSLLVLNVMFKTNQALGSALRVADLYKNPTIRGLAARVQGDISEDEYVELSREAALGEEPVVSAAHRSDRERDILLTGASGFVGRFLLARLLADTDATIYCLVRAQSQQQAWLRLRSTLLKWDLWREELASRIVAVVADLRLPRLGLDESAYATLCGNVDTIYHCATSMNHLETYAMARSANVDSARELLRLAARDKPKLINYISTLAVFNSAGGPGRIIDETTPTEAEKHSIANGYAASKWVGEKIFMSAAEQGIPCNIFRLGLVWADAEQGRYDELQREYRLLKSCLLSGFAIEGYQYRMPPTPVDYVARAIVALANRHPKGRGVFHISSPHQAIGGVFEHCNAVCGTSLELVSYYDWVQELKRLHHAGRSMPLVPLIEFAFSMDEKSLNRHQRNLQARRLRFDCSRTQQALEKAGIPAPVLDDYLLRLCLEGMQARDPDLHEFVKQRSRMVLDGSEFGLRLG